MFRVEFLGLIRTHVACGWSQGRTYLGMRQHACIRTNYQPRGLERRTAMAKRTGLQLEIKLGKSFHVHAAFFCNLLHASSDLRESIGGMLGDNRRQIPCFHLTDHERMEVERVPQTVG